MWCYFYPIALNGYTQRQSAKYEERGQILASRTLAKEDKENSKKFYSSNDYQRHLYRKEVRYNTKNNIDQYNAPSPNVFSLGDALDGLKIKKDDKDT